MKFRCSQVSSNHSTPKAVEREARGGYVDALLDIVMVNLILSKHFSVFPSTDAGEMSGKAALLALSDRWTLGRNERLV